MLRSHGPDSHSDFRECQGHCEASAMDCVTYAPTLTDIDDEVVKQMLA